MWAGRTALLRDGWGNVLTNVLCFLLQHDKRKRQEAAAARAAAAAEEARKRAEAAAAAAAAQQQAQGGAAPAGDAAGAPVDARAIAGEIFGAGGGPAAAPGGPPADPEAAAAEAAAAAARRAEEEEEDRKRRLQRAEAMRRVRGGGVKASLLPQCSPYTYCPCQQAQGHRRMSLHRHRYLYRRERLLCPPCCHLDYTRSWRRSAPSVRSRWARTAATTATGASRPRACRRGRTPGRGASGWRARTAAGGC